VTTDPDAALWLSIEQVRACIEAVHVAGIDGRPIPTAGKQVVASYADLSARLAAAKAEAILQRTSARNCEARRTEPEAEVAQRRDSIATEALRAERDALREALRRIANHQGYGDYVACGCLDGVKEIARAALAADEEDVPGAFGPGRIWNPAVFRAADEDNG
jgi:hypothetical protein